MFGRHLKKRRDQILKAIQNKTGLWVDIWAATSIKNLLEQQKITDYKVTPKSKMPQLPKDYWRQLPTLFLGTAKGLAFSRQQYGGHLQHC